MDLVSVIIPVKNGLENLRRLLDSLDRLDHPAAEREIVVCDNGSSDGTQELARARGCRVLDLPGLSIAGLRNRGAQEAKGSILAFVDSDCTVSRGWIRAALPHLERSGVVAAGCYPIPPENSTWVQELWTLKERLKPSIHETPWLPSMNLLVHRPAFEAVGGFDATLRTCEDVDFCYRLRDRGGLIVWDDAIGVTHYGEPATLGILFKKERWHGVSNYHGLLRHGIRREELPSLIIPVVVFGAYMLPLVAVPVGMFTGGGLHVAGASLLLIPPALALAAAGRVAWRAGRPGVFLPLTAIFLVYLTARAAAVIPDRDTFWQLVYAIQDRGEARRPGAGGCTAPV